MTITNDRKYKYYIKKLGHQELGSVGNDGRPNRGRYILLSKNTDILSMFPPLTTVQKNDSALISIKALYSGIKTYCTVVYHNDKYHGSTAGTPRDEIRLYLNKELENGMFLFRSNNFIIMRTVEVGIDIDGRQEREKFYAIDYVDASNIKEYAFLNSLVPYVTNSGHYLFEGEIDFFEQRLRGSIFTKTVVDDSVTDQLVKEEKQGKSIAGLFNSQTFRDFVLAGYNYKCAITNMNIQWNDFYNIEAAHIMPKSHSGEFLPSNGIALCRDMHWAFDKGFFTINNDLTIRVHDEITSSYLREYDGRKIFIPENAFFIPECNNLEYHQSNVFGLFLTSGRL